MATLEEKIDAGRLLITAELPVIDGGGLTTVERHVALMDGFPDAINATDNTAAHAHASPLAVALGIRQAGVEPIMQLVCRDRNRLALQAEVVGAALHGIRNVCCLTGDDVSAGDEPEARRVFDVDSTGLIVMARTLTEGRYLSGRRLEPPPQLLIGAVENPAAPPVDYRVRRAAKKVGAGARFLQLQSCFDSERLAEFMAEAVDRSVAASAAILPSVIIVRGARALRFMDTQVPGISVPASVIEAIEGAADQEAACFELAVRLAAEALALPGVRGLHLISFRRDSGIAQLCRRLGIPSRDEREGHGHGSTFGDHDGHHRAGAAVLHHR